MGFKERKEKRKKHYLENVFGWKLAKCAACTGTGHYDAAGSPKCAACDMGIYYGFMIGVFGKAYLLDLIKHKLKVSDEFVATHLSLIAAAPDERFLNAALQDNSINQTDLELSERFAGLL